MFDVPPPDWPLLSLALAACAAAAFTPGPNNTICMSAAASFGFRSALPFAFGVTAGFPLLLAAMGLGLGELLSRAPQLHLFIKIGGSIFLLHMAWRIAVSRGFGKSQNDAPGFTRGVLFQWVNPKALAYSTSIVAAFARPGDSWVSDVFYLTAISAAVALASTLTWAGFGAGIRHALQTPRSLAIFNGVMGAMLALAALGILFS